MALEEKIVRVQSVEVLDKFWVRLVFTDGTQKEIDLEPYLRGPVFEPSTQMTRLCSVR